MMSALKNRANHAKPWHADDIEELSALIFAGRSIPELAHALGRTQEAVRTKANDLNFLPKRARRKPVSSGQGKTRAFAF